MEYSITEGNKKTGEFTFERMFDIITKNPGAQERK